MTLIKRNKIWHYQTKVGGKTHRRSTGQSDRRNAEKVAKQIENEVRLLKKPLKDSRKLSQAISREVARIEIDISKRQAERALCSFTAFLEWLGKDPDIGAITHDLIEAFQRHRLTTVSMGSVNKDISFILRMLRHNDLHIRRPSPKQGRRTIVRAFTSSELRALFQRVTSSTRPLYATLLATGARPAELVPSKQSTPRPLLKTEVDFEAGVVRIRQAKARSDYQPRERPPIPLPREVLDLLREQVARTPSDYPFVFKSSSKARDFDRTLARAGIEKIDAAGRKLVLHSFRHTYATLMAGQLHNNPHFLKFILGHAKITTTDRYCQVVAPAVPIPDLDFLSQKKPKQETEDCPVIQVDPARETA